VEDEAGKRVLFALTSDQALLLAEQLDGLWLMRRRSCTPGLQPHRLSDPRLQGRGVQGRGALGR
jgi:hypothetical protein